MNALIHPGSAQFSEALLAELRGLLSSEAVLRPDEPMSRRTTLRVGGPADVYIEPACETDLVEVCRFCLKHSLPVLVVGRGSNLLVRDKGIRGVVVCLAHAAFGQIQVQGHELFCGAGVRLKAMAQAAKQNSITGLEFLEGIPGTLGGALRMNAGAMGSSIFDLVQRVRVMSGKGEVDEVPAVDLHATYRSCEALRDKVVLAAVLRGAPGETRLIQEKMDEFSRRRWASQPAQASAGCIFKNPSVAPAGKVIQDLGLKNKRVGGAMVSSVHGNFIVNNGEATAADILELIRLIRERAKTELGISLETEVQIIGE